MYKPNDDRVIPNIYDRMKRLKVIYNSIVFKQEFKNSNFLYIPKE